MAPKKRRVPTNAADGRITWAAKRRSGAAAAASSTCNVNDDDDDDDDDDDAPQDGSTNADGTGDDMSQGGGGSASVGEASSSSASQSFDCGDIEVDAVATDPVGLVGCRVVVPWKDTRNKRQRTAASVCVVDGYAAEAPDGPSYVVSWVFAGGGGVCRGKHNKEAVSVAVSRVRRHVEVRLSLQYIEYAACLPIMKST